MTHKPELNQSENYDFGNIRFAEYWQIERVFPQDTHNSGCGPCEAEGVENPIKTIEEVAHISTAHGSFCGGCRVRHNRDQSDLGARLCPGRHIAK